METKYFDHTADVEFEVYGETLEALFSQAAKELFKVMVPKLTTVRPKVSRKIEVEGNTLETLMYDFLEQLIILHDSENLMFSEFTVDVEKGEGYTLRAVAKGEAFDEGRHVGGTLVKAATYHAMKIGKKGTLWFCHLVLDI